MRLIEITKLDGTTESLSYCLTHMCRTILGIYGSDEQAPWIES